jgi:lactate permease
MQPLLAALPILLILVLMLGAGWSAARAGTVGAVAAMVVGVLAFGFPAVTAPGLTLGGGLAGVFAEAGFTTLTILWIIGPALGIHELQLRTGAADVLRAALAAVSPDPRVLALIVAWFFALFMEGAAGFGASVALAAPFLVAAGFRPVEAVTIALIGHSVGVSFGAVGTPVLPQMAATGATGLELARATGVYHALLGWLPLGVVVAIVQSASPDSERDGRIWGWAAAAFACFVVPYSLLWAFVGPELPTLGGALFGGVLFVLALRLFGGRSGTTIGGVALATPAAGVVLRAAAPYVVLVAVVLVTRLVPALRTALQGVVLDWEIGGGFGGSMQPLYHPGSVLLIGFVAGALLQRASAEAIGGAFARATLRLVPVVVALLAMLVLSRAMVHAGMTQSLAVAAAAAAGAAWPAVAPFVGALGTFVTGSATASNILFTDLQRETALRLGLPVTGVAGAQGFGAAAGNMVCPHNIVAAGATVGLHNREGEILRRTLGVTLGYLAAGWFLALGLVRP